MIIPAQNLIVLKENKDSYEPDAEEIYEYGQHLGLTFPEDDRFIPMLYQALKASLPDDWEAVQAKGYEDMVFYRNKTTNLVQQDHPIDGLYRDKIHKLKAMTADLAFEVIAEQTESWLRESSDVMRNSKLSADQIKRSSGQVFVQNISEEQSFYEGSASSQAGDSSSRRGSRKMMHSARTYRKKKQQLIKKIKIPKEVEKALNFQQKLEVLKEELSTYWPAQAISLEKIQSQDIGCIQLESQFKYLDQINRIIIEIENKKAELASIKLQKQRKYQKINFLKQQR